MRLSGLAAGIATFAVLEITHNVLQPVGRDRARRRHADRRPRDDRAAAGDDRRDDRDRRRVRLPAEPARAACCARPREDPAAARGSASTCTGSGSGRSRSRARWRGSRAGCYVHFLGSITTDQVYLDLTFLTLAMLVVGGMTSLWGAVRRGARRQRARLVPQQGRGRRPPRLHARPAAGNAADLPRRDHGARAHPAAVGDHGRPRVLARVAAAARVRALALGAALVVGLAACGGSGEPKKELLPGTLTIGAVVVSARDRVIARGARIDVGEINSLGGIAGKVRVRFVTEPSAGRLVRRGARVVLLPCEARQQVRAEEALRGQNVFMLATCNYLTPTRAWAVGPSVDDRAAALAATVQDRGVEKADVVASGAATGRALRDELVARGVRRGHRRGRPRHRPGVAVGRVRLRSVSAVRVSRA